MKKTIGFMVLVLLLLALVPVISSAQDGVTCAEEVVVQKDDWLSKYADKYLGNVLSWPAVMAWNNKAAAAAPDKYDKIENADLIVVGWSLCIPSAEDAEAFLATYDPGKPEDLYAGGEAGQLVVGSWWTAGGEAEGLAGMYKIYEEKYPGVEIVNAAVAGGAGSNFKAVNKTRLIAGDPADTFQLHAGLEVESYSPEQYLAPLDDLYAADGLEQAFPPDLLALLKAYGGHYWGVPVNIHRSNVLWYNKALFDQAGVQPPTTFEEFAAVSDALIAAGIAPFAFGNAGSWEAVHTLEVVLAGTCGADKYRGLFDGSVPWTDECVAASLENFKMMVSYANTDYPAHSWDGAAQNLVDDKAAMLIMGDWTDGWFTSKGYTEYGWAPPPGTQGIFVALSDSFSLPAEAPNEENALNWLSVCGSLAGQEAFNPQKGSICARMDCNPELFNPYLKSAMVDWNQDAIVASLAHGAAAKESWVADITDLVTLFLTSGDVAGTQAALQQTCVDAGVCQ